MIDRRPLALVRCADSTEVSIVVKATTAAGIPLCVKGGGHQISGGAIVEDGVVIDLGLMRTVDVDVVAKTVTVGGGALLGDLDRAVARHGLAVPAGVVSHTGVGGLVLGGGIGWLSRSRGLTIDSLLGARVITGDGDVVAADELRNADLFWAVRGGGGSFGVVVEYTFGAEPIGPVTFGTRVVRLSEARQALEAYGSCLPTLPRELQVMVKLQKMRDGEVGTFGGEPAITFEWLWCGDPQRAHDAVNLLGLARFGTERVRVTNFAAVQSQQDHRYPHGYRYFLKPGHLAGISSDVIETIIAAAGEMPTEDAQIELLLLGGAVDDVPEGGCAYPNRSAAIAFTVTGGWRDRRSDDEHSDWCRATHAALSRSASPGGYVNFLGADGPLALSDVFGEQKLAKLRQIKRTYDPNDVFQPPVHITPAEPEETIDRPVLEEAQ